LLNRLEVAARKKFKERVAGMTKPRGIQKDETTSEGQPSYPESAITVEGRDRSGKLVIRE